MSWYKSPEWQNCLVTFDDWWFWTTEYTNEDGDLEMTGIEFTNEKGEQEKGSLWSLTIRLVDSLIDVAGLDPMPVWDVYRFIDNRRSEKQRQKLGQPAGNRIWDTVSIPEISDRLQQVMMLRDRCHRVGLTDEKPSSESAISLEAKRLKPQPETLEVITMLQKGLDINAIQERTLKDFPAIHQIRSRLKRDLYDLGN